MLNTKGENLLLLILPSLGGCRLELSINAAEMAASSQSCLIETTGLWV